jgi:PAS domain S-box-containing protein
LISQTLLARFLLSPPGTVFVATFLLVVAGSRSFAQNTNPPPSVLTNLGQVHDLDLATGAHGIPVNLQPVVTYIDREWRMCFVQDACGSAYVERTAPSSDSSWDLQLGQRVQLDGITSRGVIQCNVHENKLQFLGPGSLPKPQILGSDESFKNMPDATWVKASGVITGVRTMGSKMDVDLRLNQHRSVRAIILGGITSIGIPPVGTMAEMTGVFGLDLDSNNQPTGKYMLWVQSPSLVQLNGPVPTTAISDLTGSEPNASRDGLVHVRGNIVNQSPDFLFVRDQTGTIRVEYKSPESFGKGSPVEIFGYIRRQNSGAVLEDAIISTPNANGSSSGVTAIPPPAGANTNLPTLTQIRQVRGLPASLASKSYPVHIHGVVTYQDPTGSLQFVQDRSGGIFIDSQVTHMTSFPNARQLVDVQGFSAPGDYAPVVEVQTVRVIGKGNYPEPLSAPMQVLMTGAEDSQWVTVNGVVRGESVTNNTTVLSMATGDSVMDVVVPNESEHTTPHSLVDAWIEVQGVCGTIFDTDRNLTGIRLFVPGWDQVQMWTPGVDDPFALPVRSISALLEFRAGATGLHRSHVQGTVLARRLDGSFYLQDETGGVLIQPQKSSTPVKAGEAVELVGFPSVIDRLPVLQEAVVRPLKHGPVPHAARITADTPFNQKLNGTLTRFQARVIEHSSSSSQESLMVQFGPWITDAILEKDQPNNLLAHIQPGSIVELTGVYLARLDDNRKVQSFQLLCRNADDVRVLSWPSWWTARRVGWLFAGLAVTLGLALGWVTSLRRQVHQRTRELRASEERFSKAFQASPIPMAILRCTDGHFLDANQSFLVLSGYPAEQLLEHSPVELQLWAAEPNSAPNPLSLEGRLRNQSRALRQSDGSIRQTLISTEPISLGAVPCLLLIVEDITEQLKLETQLRQVQKMEVIGRMASGIAHEFNNIHTVIQGDVGLLLTARLTDAERRNLLDHIMKASQRTASVTRQLLAFSRKQVLQPSLLNLSAVVQNTREMLTRLLEGKHKIEFRCSGELPSILADEGGLQQILVNLVLNARDAMPGEGVIEITTELAVLDKAAASAYPNGRPGSFACLTVADHGHGMTPEVLAHIFDPFFTTKEVGKGTGLGLTAIHGVVKQHEGWIAVTSEVGRGSTFKIFLPLSNATSSPAPGGNLESFPATEPGPLETVLDVGDKDRALQTHRLEPVR